MTIILGEDRTIILSFRTSSGYYSLAGTDELEIKFPGQEGTISKTVGDGVEITEGGGDDGQDIATVTLSDTDTAGLNVDENQQIEVTQTVGSITRIFQPSETLNVRAQLYPDAP